MKKRTLSFAVLTAVLVAAYVFVDQMIEPPPNRLPASVPDNYEAMKACQKQDVLWAKIQESTYKELPDYRSLGLFELIGMKRQEIATKGKLHADFAPEGWRKFLHGRASIAKIKIAPLSPRYTGVFQGADCGLLRLSLTSKVSGNRPVAPGLALKVLRDGVVSANISALVSLDGQGKDYNFFKNPMSNIVPVGGSFGQRMVHEIFRKASQYPEELVTADMAMVDARGSVNKEGVAPRQLFFVPNSQLQFSSEEHEVRKDFAAIPAGTAIYKIYAVSEKYKDFNYFIEYKAENVEELLKDSEPIAEIVMTSEFVASSFGDDGIFFRHQLRPL